MKGAAHMKDNKSGWQFPKALEIIKCKEGNKEFMKERPARRPFGNTVLICEYPIDDTAAEEPNAKLITWRRGILQSALRTRDRQVGSKGFRGSAGGVSDCFTYPSADRHSIFSRLHLRESGNPLRARAATVHGRRRKRRRSRALPVNGSYL